MTHTTQIQELREALAAASSALVASQRFITVHELQDRLIDHDGSVCDGAGLAGICDGAEEDLRYALSVIDELARENLRMRHRLAQIAIMGERDLSSLTDRETTMTALATSALGVELPLTINIGPTGLTSDTSESIQILCEAGGMNPDFSMKPEVEAAYAALSTQEGE